MKLFTIGDSLSQGFMSGAAARTDLCYSTLLARALGLGLDVDYHIPYWEHDGHPVNLERLLRQLPERLGSDISGPFEWLQAKFWINQHLSAVEAFYEDGAGALHRPYPGREWFHNIAIRGFDVADAWLVTPRLCRRVIGERSLLGRVPGFGKPPSQSFFRTAMTVLNPSRKPAFDDFSALDWLNHHVRGEGVENLVLWLGPNNILGSVIGLNPRSTAGASKPPLELAYEDRRNFNLWTAEHFRAEYQELIRRIDALMANNKFAGWKVFVANVPSVTVPPILRGHGQAVPKEDPFGHLPRATYFERYNYVFESEVGGLDLETVRRIDETVAAYNAIIAEICGAANDARADGTSRYFVVDISRSFLELAFKRNQGQPTYKLPDVFDRTPRRPDTRYYRVRADGVLQGGIFSLDGVHPTAIGQGLVAHEFKQIMVKAGVQFVDDLDWPSIVAGDQLWARPLGLVEELFQHADLISLMRKLTSAFRNDAD